MPARKRKQSVVGQLISQRGLLFALKFWMIKSLYFNLKKRLEFYRVIRTFTTNGISIQSSLQQYLAMLRKYSKDDGMIFVCNDLLQMMANGVRFEQAMARWVPEEELAIIENSSKDMTRACEVVTLFAENMMQIKNALVQSLTYPIVMVIILIVCLMGFALFMIPMMEQVSPHESWPPIAQGLYSLTTAIKDDWALFLSIIIVVAVFSIWSLPRLTNVAFRSLLDHLPPWNIYKLYTSTSFLIALSSLIKTGSSFHNSVRKMGETASPYLMLYLRRILRNLSTGSNFGDSLVVGLFQGNLLISLAVFASTNRLEQGIQYLADENLEEQRLVFIRKGRNIGYALMILVAGVIGWVMLSLYQIQSTVQIQ